MLEVCIDSLSSAIAAIHGEADELEVCSSLSEGGLTPTAGLVKEVLSAVAKISKKTISKECEENCSCLKLTKKPKVNVMLRCRTGSDFCYSNLEMDTMLADLHIFKSLGVDRFVFGSLTHLGQHPEICESSCNLIIKEAAPIPVTFHRAFDLCGNPLESLEMLINLGFTRLLTSGQKPSAGDSEAMILIKSLLQKSDARIEIMPGAGVTPGNARSLVDIGCKIVHSSCKVKKELLKAGLSFGTSESECLYFTDEDIVKELKGVITA